MKLRLSLLVLLLILMAAFYYISTDYYSAGERAGTISKFSERGYIFKTHEGELHEGGFSGETGTLNPRYWHFSVKEDTVVQKLRKALNTGERVTLQYQEKFVKFPWNGDTKYIITDVVFLPSMDKGPVFYNYPHPDNREPIEEERAGSSPGRVETKVPVDSVRTPTLPAPKFQTSPRSANTVEPV